jgi:hypothetical protein
MRATAASVEKIAERAITQAIRLHDAADEALDVGDTARPNARVPAQCLSRTRSGSKLSARRRARPS